MVNSFINPAIGRASKLGISVFEDSEPLEYRTGDSETDFETLIRAVYKQVLGNAHIMESERLKIPESQLKNREITVREFVRQVAKSELYRSRFFDHYPRYRFIELSFKHLLGRAPNDHAEMQDRIKLLDEFGIEAGIDSYLDSEEYNNAFGENTVPYYRGYKTQTGKNMLGFTHFFQLLRGNSSSDKSSVLETYSGLNKSLMTNTPLAIIPLTGPPAYRQLTDINKLVADVLKLNRVKTSPPTASKKGSTILVEDESRQQQYQAFESTAPIELRSDASPDDIEIVIRAVYRQVMGNAYVMESERLVVAESQFRQGFSSVREFVRQVAKSELYRSRFFDNCYRYRAIELNFKHLLGRAPDSYDEMKPHSAILDTEGFEADIDSYIDSDEYIDAFGENIVPFYRGYSSQPGRSMLGFTNMFQMLRSNSSSDKELTSPNKPRLVRSLIRNSPFGKQKISNVDAILAEVFKPKPESAEKVNLYAAKRLQEERELQQQIEEQQKQINSLQAQLSELSPFANIGAVQLNSSWQSQAAVDHKQDYQSLQQQLEAQKAQISSLEAQIADARRFATIGEARLNKWRSRVFSS